MHNAITQPTLTSSRLRPHRPHRLTGGRFSFPTKRGGQELIRPASQKSIAFCLRPSGRSRKAVCDVTCSMIICVVIWMGGNDGCHWVVGRLLVSGSLVGTVTCSTLSQSSLRGKGLPAQQVCFQYSTQQETGWLLGSLWWRTTHCTVNCKVLDIHHLEIPLWPRCYPPYPHFYNLTLYP